MMMDPTSLASLGALGALSALSATSQAFSGTQVHVYSTCIYMYCILICAVLKYIYIVQYINLLTLCRQCYCLSKALVHVPVYTIPVYT